MKSKNDHQVLGKLPDKLQLRVRVGIRHTDFHAVPFQPKFSSPDAPTNESPTACVKQVANFPLPSLLPNQSDTLHTARSAAAEGYLSIFTIPLLAEPETLVQTARLNWFLRFPLPRSNRRFFSTPSYHYGPRTPQGLDAASYAANFSYYDPPPTHPHAAAFVQLPDPAIRFGDIRRPPLFLHAFIPLITFGFNS